MLNKIFIIGDFIMLLSLKTVKSQNLDDISLVDFIEACLKDKKAVPSYHTWNSMEFALSKNWVEWDYKEMHLDVKTQQYIKGRSVEISAGMVAKDAF